MKTREILTQAESELAPKLKQLKLKELEKHAKKILQRLGQSDYDYILSVLIKAVPNLQSEDRFKEVQSIIEQHVNTASNDSPEDDAALIRVSSILMLIVSRKFEKILKEQS